MVRKKLFVWIFVIFLLFGTCFPLFQNIQINKCVYAENQTYSIIAPNFSLGVQSIEKVSFTPLNKNTGKRFGEVASFRAYKPSLSSTTTVKEKQIDYIDKTINIASLNLSNINIPYDDACLEFWVYFETISTRDFEITLTFEDLSACTWRINHKSLMMQISGDDAFEDGLGWSHIALNFNNATLKDEVSVFDDVSGKFKKPISFSVKQVIDEENVLEVELWFYDVKIASKNMQNDIEIIEKQPYFYYNFNFDAFFSALNGEIYVGDYWFVEDITKQQNAYCWYGQNNLITKMKLVYNNDKSNVIEFENNFEFFNSGAISFTLCAELNSKDVFAIEESHRIINVYAFTPIFLKFDKLSAVVSNSYEVSFEINKKLTNIKDLQVLSDNDKIEIESLNSENQSFVMKSKDVGSSVVTISFKATRNGKEQIYTDTIQIKSNSKKDTSQTMLAIFCIVGGITVVGFGVYCVIKKIKNANKYNVK